jgi:hypothetical protein
MLFFEDFLCGFPYEVYPTPAKGKDGGYIVYARPAKGHCTEVAPDDAAGYAAQHTKDNFWTTTASYYLRLRKSPSYQ